MENKIEKPHTLSIEQVIEKTKTDPKVGLSSSQAQERLEKYGRNELDPGERVSALKILFNNINNIIVYLLLGASAVAFLMGDPIEGFAVMVALLIAIVSGFVSEYKAQKSVESLQDMTKTVSKVRRDGNIKEIPSEELVVGDILFVEEGDSITADSRIIESKNFASIEAALTGESEAVNKDHNYESKEDDALGDRFNMIYTGTAATRGNAYAVVSNTGVDTEIGKISTLLDEGEKTATPLEEQLDKLGKALIVFSAAVALLVTIIGILYGEETYEMIKIGIILAIAAVPEALPAVSTITLAIGMRTMASHNALVKNLPAVETLGSTTVICTDKTGTLTENQMTIKEIHLSNGEKYQVEGTGYTPEGNITKDDETVNISEESSLETMIKAGILSSNASLVEEDGQYKVIGDPTEGGIIVLGKKASLDRRNLEENNYNRIGEIPFNSKDKFMATAYEIKGKEKRVYIKGAPDVLLEMDKSQKNNKNDLENINEDFAAKGMRVLAIGEVKGYEGDGSEESMQKAIGGGIELLGFIGILDPPREDVKQAIKEAQSAGIRVIMITGDHPKTALSIAEQIGMNNTEKVVTGKEMDKMTDEELAEKILSTSVFARVSPENKLQIIRALTIDNEITAMTGDGVNDAPALNGADIGIAMGIRGTEVAKDASDMILTDDKFSTIVQAVKEGRVIFDNIEKFVYFLFSCNVVEILAVFLSIIFRLPMPILAIQILWLNLVTNVFPAMSLAWEPGESDIMKRSPRDPKETIVNKSFLSRILFDGALIGIGSLVVFWYGLSNYDEITARTMSFSAMAFGQLLHVLNAREKKEVGIKKDILKNPFLIISLIISGLIQLVAIYVPFMNIVMGTVPLDTYKWGIITLGAFVPTLIIQLNKARVNRKHKTRG
jgi:P-type Ca2+ transporter type 2C